MYCSIYVVYTFVYMLFHFMSLSCSVMLSSFLRHVSPSMGKPIDNVI